MRVSIIGSGNVGSALATSLARRSHQVTVSARDEAKASAVAAEAGARSAPIADAVSQADVVLLAVPYAVLGDVAARIRDDVAGKVVVDATNPLKADYSGLATGAGKSAAEELAELLPEARVVKAFNTLFASVQADPKLHGDEVDGLFAGDDDDALDTVAGLLVSIGFRPVLVGPLSAARELEALAWLNISLNSRSGGDWRTAYRLVGVPAAAVRVPLAA